MLNVIRTAFARLANNLPIRDPQLSAACCGPEGITAFKKATYETQNARNVSETGTSSYVRNWVGSGPAGYAGRLAKS